MSSLILTPNIDDCDTFYAELIALQENLSDTEAQVLLSKLLLILANHIGDREILQEAFDIASA